MSKEKKETKDNQNLDIYKVIKDLEEFFGGNTNAAVRVVNDAAIEAAYKRGYEARKQEAKENDRGYKDGLADGYKRGYEARKQQAKENDSDYKDGLVDGRFEVLYALKKISNNERLRLLFGAYDLDWVIEKYEAEEIIDKVAKFDKEEEGEPLPCMTCERRNGNCQLNSIECHYNRHYRDDEIEKCKQCTHYPESGISSNAVCIICEDNQYFDSIHNVKVGDVVKSVNPETTEKYGEGIVTGLQPIGTGTFGAYVVWSCGVAGNFHTAMLRRTGKRYDSLEKLMNLIRR